MIDVGVSTYANLDTRTGNAVAWFFLNIRLEHNCFVSARALAFSSRHLAPKKPQLATTCLPLPRALPCPSTTPSPPPLAQGWRFKKRRRCRPNKCLPRAATSPRQNELARNFCSVAASPRTPGAPFFGVKSRAADRGFAPFSRPGQAGLTSGGLAGRLRDPTNPRGSTGSPADCLPLPAFIFI